MVINMVTVIKTFKVYADGILTIVQRHDQGRISILSCDLRASTSKTPNPNARVVTGYIKFLPGSFQSAQK